MSFELSLLRNLRGGAFSRTCAPQLKNLEKEKEEVCGVEKKKRKETHTHHLQLTFLTR